MKGSIFGSGPATTNGTRQFYRPGNGSKAEVATGKARASGPHLNPPLPAWMADPRRKCKDKPTRWWYAPEEDEHGNRVSTKLDALEAERLCGICPLALECREYGLRNEPFGRWGGIRLDNLKVKQRRDLLARVVRDLQRRAS